MRGVMNAHAPLKSSRVEPEEFEPGRVGLIANCVVVVEGEGVMRGTSPGDDFFVVTWGCGYA